MITHTPFTGSAHHRANLEQLHDHLLTVKQEQFNMAWFATKKGRRLLKPPATHCGTVACAVGEAAIAGIGEWRKGDDWLTYSSRELCPEGDEGNWLFAGNWHFRDNSPAGAAARIRVLLDQGLPSNSWPQLMGYAPLSYTVSA